MNAILEIKDVCKSYDGVPVLNQINFQVQEGEFVAIMGRSGSGKSTLLYSISGMDRPSSGQVLLYHQEMAGLKEEDMSKIRLTKMGFVFQHSYLLKHLSIMDNIVLPGFQAKQQSRDKINQRAHELMEKTGITSIASHDITKVSGGQLQRAAICRALINSPAIVFGDEPTGALNSSSSKEVMDIFSEINKEKTTIILVTHDAKVAARANRIIYLMDGKIYDELEIGFYDGVEEHLMTREKFLADWLTKLDF